MPHMILASAGTHGDVFPYVALGRELLRRGHRVTLAVNEGYQELANQLGFEFAALISEDETQALLQNPDVWHPVKCGVVGARWGASVLPRHYEVMNALSAEPDSVMVASPAIMAARMIQEKFGRPLVSIKHIPWIIASSSSPPAMTSGYTLPTWAPRPLAECYWWTVDMALHILMRGAFNRFRKSIGLPPVYRVFRWWTSPDLAIGLFPDWYAEPQPDWPPQLKVSGFPVFDGQSDGKLDEEVLNFCHNNGPPVVFTFGTGMQHARELFEEASQACLESGRSGILLSRDASQIPSGLPESVRHFSYVPLRQLLPHCSAIVHHGGMGTTARALAAGTPQLIVPHAWDQLDNALRVMRLNVGRMLKRRHCTADQISQSLSNLLTDSTKKACQQIADRCDPDVGGVKAADWIEEWYANRPAEVAS